jgi:hypothetical protein
MLTSPSRILCHRIRRIGQVDRVRGYAQRPAEDIPHQVSGHEAVGAGLRGSADRDADARLLEFEPVRFTARNEEPPGERRPDDITCHNCLRFPGIDPQKVILVG